MEVNITWLYSTSFCDLQYLIFNVHIYLQLSRVGLIDVAD
ncbi:hypothetical protein ACUXN8_002406 [Staphylococcus capitis]